NKVAVSEGAAGSPPFYGETNKRLFKIQGRNYEESFRKCCLILRVLEKGFSGDMRNERELYVP
ncbi:hypothetical protein, partial [Candidatus Pseudoruminococcus sp.]|uniref:hypothetical protein n=1 Tax=Candidatus Pseudoruminococcus sp. TaxID=3101048 RepID=UPI00399ABF3E